MGRHDGLPDSTGLVDNSEEPMPFWNHRDVFLGVIISLIVVKWVFAYLRLHARFFLIKSPGMDDFFFVLCLISSTVGSMCCCLSLTIVVVWKYGLGKHYLTLGADGTNAWMKVYYPSQIANVTSLTCIKLSLLFQYLRLYEDGIYRKLCMVAMAATSVWGIAFLWLSVAPCIPIHEYFELKTKDSICYGFGSRAASEFVLTVTLYCWSNTFLDLVVFALPIPLYFVGKTERRTRLGLLALFIAGGLVLLVATWKLIIIIQSRATTWPTLDPTWYGPAIYILAVGETDLACMCASAPVFWPVMRKKLDRVFVTHEIRIMRRERNDDEFELHNPRSGSLSDSADNAVSGLPLTPDATRQHYSDAYIQRQVNPFSMEKEVTMVATEVISETARVRRKDSISRGSHLGQYSSR